MVDMIARFRQARPCSTSAAVGGAGGALLLMLCAGCGPQPVEKTIVEGKIYAKRPRYTMSRSCFFQTP